MKIRLKTDKRCSIEGCNKRFRARGLCSTHYARLMDYGDPNHVPRSDSPRVDYAGESLTVAEWARRIGINPSSLTHRLRNWPIDEALTTPAKRSRRSVKVRLMDDQDAVIASGTKGVLLRENHPRIGLCVVKFEIIATVQKSEIRVVR